MSNKCLFFSDLAGRVCVGWGGGGAVMIYLIELFRKIVQFSNVIL